MSSLRSPADASGRHLTTHFWQEWESQRRRKISAQGRQLSKNMTDFISRILVVFPEISETRAISPIEIRDMGPTTVVKNRPAALASGGSTYDCPAWRVVARVVPMLRRLWRLGSVATVSYRLNFKRIPCSDRTFLRVRSWRQPLLTCMDILP